MILFRKFISQHTYAFQSTQDCQSSSGSVQSEYQVLHEYYKDIQAAALRTYITAQLSYMILNLHESSDFRNQSLIYQEHFRQENAAIRKVFMNKLMHADRDVWACDPTDYNGSFKMTQNSKRMTIFNSQRDFNKILSLHVHGSDHTNN